MPAFIKTARDEQTWERAKAHFRESKGREPRSSQDWGLVTTIYQRSRAKHARWNGPKEDVQAFLAQSPWPKDIAHLEDWLVAAAEAGRPAADEALASLARGTSLEAIWKELQVPLLHAVDVDLRDGDAVRARVKHLLTLHGMRVTPRNYLWEAAELLSAWFRWVVAATEPHGFRYSHSEYVQWTHLQLVPKEGDWDGGWIIFTEEQAEALGPQLDPFYHYRVIVTERTPPEDGEDWSEPEVVDDGEDTVASLEELARLASQHYFVSEWSDSRYPQPGSWLSSGEGDINYDTGAVRETSMHFTRGDRRGAGLSYVELAALEEYRFRGPDVGPLVGKWTTVDYRDKKAFQQGMEDSRQRQYIWGSNAWYVRGWYYGEAMYDLEQRMRKEDTE